MGSPPQPKRPAVLARLRRNLRTLSECRLNEPETSLHPDLLPALAELVAVAARRCQVWIISHSSRLVAALERIPYCQSLALEKSLGETRIAGQGGLLDGPAWRWPV